MERYLTVAFWEECWQEALKTAAARGLRLLLILLVYWVAKQILNRVIESGLARLMARQAAKSWGEERAHRLATLQGLVKSVMGYVLFFLLVVMLLQAFTLDITGIVTTAGIGGLAVGFGAQRLVKDFLSGFFLIVE